VVGFGQIFEGLAIEDFGIFYCHLVYFTTIWYILWTFGTFYGFWCIFTVLVWLYQEKSGNPESWQEFIYGAGHLVRDGYL
jgi:hypothetical protein